MGRVKKYASGSKHRRSKSVIKKNRTTSNDSDSAMSDGEAPKMMTIGKRKQIFKKSKEGRREIKK